MQLVEFSNNTLAFHYGFCLFNLFFNTADVQHFDVVDFIPDYVSPIVTIEYVDLAIDKNVDFIFRYFTSCLAW